MRMAVRIAMLAIAVIALIGVTMHLFYDNVSAEIDEANGTLTVKAPSVDETILLSDIIQVDYHESNTDAGKAIFNTVSSISEVRESVSCAIATYSNTGSYIYVRHTGGFVIFNLSTTEATEDFYNRLMDAWSSA